ncbi:hypothetical protein SY86_14905 [Erwinia tracheiphila]|uniref:Uncharacterized protein n=1 Tax=Erwinia tracheiphila TaxID=65700 RepID=A0A0M2KBY6_9GAMM|nr:hypothetical protein ETR_21507 [Erwinia tracheiphila PSU-1]KKF36439.1 hypothetical protein SY86_14905 [Erwinia tracheiphila]
MDVVINNLLTILISQRTCKPHHATGDTSNIRRFSGCRQGLIRDYQAVATNEISNSVQTTTPAFHEEICRDALQNYLVINAAA